MLSIVYFVCLCIYPAFATSHEEANVVIGKNSTEADNIFIDKRNETFEKLMKLMSKEDSAKVFVYISEYRKGNKEVINDLTDLIYKYDKEHAVHIANYILKEQYITYLTSYTVDHLTHKLVETPISSVATFRNDVMNSAAASFWENFKGVVPEEFSNSIESIHFEKDKDPDNLITICESTTVPGYWDMNVDVSIVDVSNTDKLWDYFMYVTVFYYCLRDDQVEKLVETKGNYIFKDKTYRTDSYINKFYKKFWKGRRQETNTNQYSLYKKEFLNAKASRTVYDDMAVSFVNYVKNGYMRRYLGFRADKTNFFDEYEFFRNLANHFRNILSIKKIS